MKRQATQPYGRRMAGTDRQAQIRYGLAAGPKTLQELADVMVCSAALVHIYAKQMADVAMIEREVQARAGSRKKLFLELRAEAGLAL